MSGPKGYSYAVASPELPRVQAISSARSPCAELRQQLSVEVAQVRAHGETATGLDRRPRIADAVPAMALRAGGPDNVTVIILDVRSDVAG